MRLCLAGFLGLLGLARASAVSVPLLGLGCVALGMSELQSRA